MKLTSDQLATIRLNALDVYQPVSPDDIAALLAHIEALETEAKQMSDSAELDLYKQAAKEWREAKDTVAVERDRLAERLDQFDAYGITVASALSDRDENARLRAALEGK